VVKKVKSIKIIAAAVIFLTLGTIFSETLLIEAHRILMHEDRLIKSEAIVVLAGSWTGNRIKAAAKLYHKGFGKKLVFSGYQIYPGAFILTLMKTYAVKLGVPENNIITSIIKEEISTKGESISNLELLKKHQIKNFILVTSAYHSRRANLVYKKTISSLGFDIDFVTHPAPDPSVPANEWWKLRTGQKAVFLEYLKSIAYYFNL
jgi:uncharacterized SAM-binding protein YcdF (DUF218 family)